MFTGFSISIIKSAHNGINLWQFSNLVMRMHELLCSFTSRQFPYNYKANDKHFILRLFFTYSNGPYFQNTCSLLHCTLSAPGKQQLSIPLCSKRKQIRALSTHSRQVPECTQKRAGWPGSGNTSCISKDIAVHYFFHV